jgi:hypothetical protein
MNIVLTPSYYGFIPSMITISGEVHKCKALSYAFLFNNLLIKLSYVRRLLFHYFFMARQPYGPGPPRFVEVS